MQRPFEIRRTIPTLALALGLTATSLAFAADNTSRSTTPQRAREYEIKAAFLYNFVKFLRWPDERGSKPITIGIVGDDPFGDSLDKTLDGKSVRGREFVVKRVKTASGAELCDVVFIGDTASGAARDVVSRLRGKPVLTVGDTEGFTELGVVINLVVEEKRLQFDVNLSSIEGSGLVLSSHLMRLARRIEVGD